MAFCLEEMNSSALETKVPFGVVTPAAGAQGRPVIFMLHGMARWDRYYEEPMERAFFEKIAQAASQPFDMLGQPLFSLQELSDQLKVTVVAVNGGNSWYLDSPSVPKSRYETHIVSELIPFVREKFGVSRDLAGLVGHSMGGCGAVSLLCKHPDMFVCAGSRCGVMEFANQSRFGDKEWHLNSRVSMPLGDLKTHAAFWDAQSPLVLAEKIRESDRRIYLDVGAFDRPGLVDSNRRMHEKLMKLGIYHIYRETPDGHEFSPYLWELVIWSASILNASLKSRSSVQS